MIICIYSVSLSMKCNLMVNFLLLHIFYTEPSIKERKKILVWWGKYTTHRPRALLTFNFNSYWLRRRSNELDRAQINIVWVLIRLLFRMLRKDFSVFLLFQVLSRHYRKDTWAMSTMSTMLAVITESFLQLIRIFQQNSTRGSS